MDLELEFDEVLVRGRRREPDGRKEQIALMHVLAYEGKTEESRSVGDAQATITLLARRRRRPRVKYPSGGVILDNGCWGSC